jgi:GntR family transcriptional regulator, transcriptional repressor for pyruvate dehydrogenase complex
MAHPPKRHELPSERVANDLRRKIKNGEWQRGEALPSVTELCEHYGVSRATVGKALAVLSAEGLIVTRHRWGTFVAE